MSKPFIVLGIYEVHNASACLMIDGEIVAASHEERFSKTKNDVGLPIKAAKFCMNFANIKPEDIDEVAISNVSFNKNGIANVLLKRPALYSIDDWNFENNNFWKKKLFDKKKVDEHYFNLMGGTKKVKDLNHYYKYSEINFDMDNKKITDVFNDLRKKAIVEHLNISKHKIKFVEHYLCHHYHAFYSSPYRNENVLVAHLEGDGGRYNNAISTVSKKGLKVISGSKSADIGRLYQWTTLLLGMKPYHDEYKVMGLAPYATEKEVFKSYQIFKDVFKLSNNKLNITYKNKPRDLYFTFQEKLQGHRFDGIAGALQKTLEKVTIDWLSNAQKKLNKKILCYGGGVAMNVKANGLFQDYTNFNKIFVPLSPSDESNAIGACYYSTEKHFLKNGKDIFLIKPLSTPYLGPNIISKNLNKFLNETKKSRGKIKFFENFSNDLVANYLKKGKVIGRASGRSEFGQRALGNRSILANPSYSGIVQKINSAIKYRDFWMPFCPTIMSKFEKDVIINKKNVLSKYMTSSFKLKDEYKKRAFGASHTADNTVRPQILSSEDNEDYFKLIQKFYHKTNIPMLINTSLNLHREPMASDMEDCFKILKKTHLDGMIINNNLIVIED